MRRRAVTALIAIAVKDPGATLGGVSLGMVLDSRQDLVWGLGSYKRIFVLRVDPAAPAVSTEL